MANKIPPKIKIEESLAQIAHYFSYRPTGFYSTIGRIDEKLGELNQRIKDASESSDRLTKSLNRITLVGVIATAVAAIAAILGLVPIFYNFLKEINLIR